MHSNKIEISSQQQDLYNQKIRGVIHHIRYRNEDNHFTILSLLVPKTSPAANGSSIFQNKFGDFITVEVNHPSLAEGVEFEFSGHWVIHPKYGHQFKAKGAKEVPPSTTQGMISYLSSSFFKGIGYLKAKKIVDHFGSDTMRILNEEIDRLSEVSGISKKNRKEIQEAWSKNKEINDIMQFLMEHNITLLLASKIYESYGTNCVSKIKENPYDLIKRVSGVGFKKADIIAMRLGFPEDSELRLKACIVHVLDNAESDGHCYLLYDQIMNGCHEYINADFDDVLEDALINLELEKELRVIRNNDKDKRYYPNRTYFNETCCAMNIIKRTSQIEEDVALDEGFFRKELEKSSTVPLSDEQFQAVIGIIRSNISILTGGPGVGKTRTTQALVDALSLIGEEDIVLCAPTGRAAKRMREVIGMNAQTIHKTLGWDPVNGGFMHGEKNKLSGNCIIVDEFSMVDIHLAASLFRAIPDHMRVVFIGDPDQLPPVGPGNFFRDIIDSGKVKTFRLTKVFRQGDNSNIISYSHEINGGRVPDIDNPLLNTSMWEDKHDCMFIESGIGDGLVPKGQYPPSSSLRYGKDLLDMIEHLYKVSIPKYYASPDDIQVLVPIKMGPIGIHAINKRLQNSLNPKSSSKAEISINDTTFRVGDKVIQQSNNYELSVFNGDVGRISGISDDGKEVYIRYGEENIVTYKRSDMMDVDLAYAITIHKCVAEDQKILIKGKGWTPISDCEIGDEVHVGKINEFKKIVDKINTGKKRAYKITTNLGYSIVCSEEHPLFRMVDFSEHDFTKVSDIKVGDNICISRNLIKYESNKLLPTIDCHNSKLELKLPKTMTNDLAWFFGVLVGDGYYADNKKMDGRIETTFNQKEEFTIDKYLSVCNSIGLNAKYQITGENKSRVYCFSRFFMKFIRACGMNSYSCSSQKNVPTFILSSSIEHKSSFLRGLFDADASVRKSGIRLVSISKELLESCQLMLLEFGIVSKLALKGKKRTYISKNEVKINAKDSYCLTLIGPNSNKKFMENIGFTDPSKTKHLVDLCSASKGMSKTNLDIVPFSDMYRSEMSSHLKTAFVNNERKGGGKGVLGNGLNGLRDMSLKTMAYGKRKTFGFPEIKYYMDTCVSRNIYPNDKISGLSKTSFFYDRVERIEEVGHRNMYDIEVEDLHSFSCQGFIAHNSQGSEFDYVIMPIMPQYSMMLYRNLVYTGLTRAKRLAVILGSKESLVKSVNNTNYKVRQTSLKEMVLGILPSW